MSNIFLITFRFSSVSCIFKTLKYWSKLLNNVREEVLSYIKPLKNSPIDVLAQAVMFCHINKPFKNHQFKKKYEYNDNFIFIVN